MDQGAKKVIFVDTEPRLSYIKSRFPREHMDKVSLLDFKTVSSGITNSKTVVSELKELCDGRGPDVALECAAGEYAKGWMHWLEMAAGAETDTSEIVNEMIESVHSFGRCGVTGVYVGYVRTSSFPFNTLYQIELTYPDESLQYRVSHAAWYSIHRKRPSSCPYVLEGPPRGHSEQES